MDAIACQRADIPAVAGQGTALTEEQMEALWRLHPEPTLCFDGDAAGIARRRPRHRPRPAAAEARPLVPLRLEPCRGPRTPTRCCGSKGRSALRRSAGRGATPFVKRLFDREREAEPLGTPESYAGPEGAPAQARRLHRRPRPGADVQGGAARRRFEELRVLGPAQVGDGGRGGRALATRHRWAGRKGPRKAAAHRRRARGAAAAAPPVKAEPLPLAAALAQGAISVSRT